MARIAYFVDGSNLFGVLKQLNCRVDDYEKFYRHLHKLTSETWARTCGSDEPCTLQRVYWYVVGSMDEWDLNDPKAQVRLKTWYDEREELKVSYLKTAGEKLKQTNSQQKPSKEKVQSEAWGMCFSEIKEWYERKVSTLDGMRRFHHAVRAGTDGIDIIECGRWKLDLMNRTADEKGLDTRLAVDMVALEDNFDVAVVLSGDADMIPSIDLMKRRSKHVGVFEFIKGYPPENTGRGFSSHLKLSADFVTTIFEMDMVQKKVASKGVLEIDFPKEKDIASESDNNLKETQNADFGVGVNDSQ